MPCAGVPLSADWERVYSRRNVQREDFPATEPDQLQNLLREIAELRAELFRLQDLQAAPAQLNALPEKVHDYLRRLHHITDTAEDEAALSYARETIDALTRLNEELRRLLNEGFRVNS